MNLLLKCEHQTQIYPPTEVSRCFWIDHDMNQIAPYEVQVIQNKKKNWWVVVWVLKSKAVTCICSLHFPNLKSFLRLKRDGSVFFSFRPQKWA